jgi:hypothetical protein
MLNVARKPIKLYFMRRKANKEDEVEDKELQIVEIDLAKLFADS